MEKPPHRTIDEIIVSQLFDELSRTLAEIKATPTSNAKHEQWVEMYGVAKELFGAIKDHIAISSESVREFENGEYVEFAGLLCMVRNTVKETSPLQYRLQVLVGKDKTPEREFVMRGANQYRYVPGSSPDEDRFTPAAPLDEYEFMDSQFAGWTWQRKTDVPKRKSETK